MNIQEATITALQEDDSRGNAIEEVKSINNIERTLYYEGELNCFNKIYDIIKPVESFVTNWNIDFFGGKRAYCICTTSDKNAEFQIDFNTDTGSIESIFTTYSSQKVNSQFVDLVQKLYNLM